MFPGSPPVSTQQPQAQMRLSWVLAEMFVLSLALCAVPLALVVDTKVLANDVTDSGVTEILQGTMLGLVIASYGLGAWRHRAVRGYAIAAATFFTVLLVREHDGVLDGLSHGFWIYPAVVIAVLGGAAVFICRDTLWGPLVRHVNSRQAVFMTLGLVLLVVFSRIFGTGEVWESVMGDSFVRVVKNAVQEGTELMAYILLAFGAVTSAWQGFGTARSG